MPGETDEQRLAYPKNLFFECTPSFKERIDVPYWTFRDGISVHEELKNIETSRIRSVCDKQSRTKWTSIASRDRLYQFIALSDEETQREMRQDALSSTAMDTVASASNRNVPAFSSSSQFSFRYPAGPSASCNDEDSLPTSIPRFGATKRYVMLLRTMHNLVKYLHRYRTGSEASMTR